MKNYSSKRAQKGKIAFRTPSRFIYKMALKSVKRKSNPRLTTSLDKILKRKPD